MSRRAAAALLLASLVTTGCNKLAELAGAPTVTDVTIHVLPGILVGDSGQAHASATKSNGVTIPDLRPDAWRSSNPNVISIGNNGVMKAVALGQATIFADFQGKTGSAVVTVGAGDARLGYALADQESATSPYTPAASTRFNSSGGAITVTRTEVGIYTVTFAGLGRPVGGRDNVQVTGFAGGAVYCKTLFWDASGADLVVTVACVRRGGANTDSKFTILAVGARAFGASTPLGFLRWIGDMTTTNSADTAATSYNSAGGQIDVGYVSTGNYATIFVGLGPQSGGAAGPVGFIVSGSGNNNQRCQLNAYDLVLQGGSTGVTCRGSNGGFANSPFSMLWFTRGRAGFRYGYAMANNTGNTTGYTPVREASANSSGGAITAKKTATGTYQIVFAGLARPAGATEGVQVSVFGPGAAFCTLASWGNSGANDLVANVSCWDTFDAPLDAIFNVLIVQ
ncbi:MAG TPA: hypothetical protein VNS10_15855 [Gemmatimonadaceae bacterium]|jgi:hypothetical protein|nr:hypothetical protein [Gemmatimonadaceae bacterium]